MGIEQSQTNIIAATSTTLSVHKTGGVDQIEGYRPQTNCWVALRKSNLLFRRSTIGDELLGAGEHAPDGMLRVCNMHLHPKELVGFAVRAVAYADDVITGNPFETGDCGELIVDKKHIKWEIKLATKCGTLKSVANEDPATIARSLTIILPAT